MQESLSSTGLAALLDFYSDRATAHASFVVASTFGIYTVLFGGAPTTGVLPWWLFNAVCLVLLFMGGYSFMNFGYYASKAQEVRVDILEKRLGARGRAAYDRRLESKIQEMNLWLYVWSKVKSETLLGVKIRYPFFFSLWCVAVFLPFIWIAHALVITGWLLLISGAVVEVISAVTYMAQERAIPGFFKKFPNCATGGRTGIVFLLAGFVLTIDVARALRYTILLFFILLPVLFWVLWFLFDFFYWKAMSLARAKKTQRRNHK